MTDTRKQPQSLGSCPECGKPVTESKIGFGCSGYKEGCKFILWKDNKFLKVLKKKMTKTLAQQLLTLEPVFIKDATSSKGRKFDCYLQLQKGERGNWNFDMTFPER